MTTESLDELRDEFPSRWRILVQNESVGYVLDTLIDAMPGDQWRGSK